MNQDKDSYLLKSNMDVLEIFLRLGNSVIPLVHLKQDWC